MLSSDFLFPRFFVVPLANPSNFSHCKCFSSRISGVGRGGAEGLEPPPFVLYQLLLNCDLSMYSALYCMCIVTRMPDVIEWKCGQGHLMRM